MVRAIHQTMGRMTKRGEGSSQHFTVRENIEGRIAMVAAGATEGGGMRVLEKIAIV